jgi:hypothetical protein
MILGFGIDITGFPTALFLFEIRKFALAIIVTDKTFAGSSGVAVFELDDDPEDDEPEDDDPEEDEPEEDEDEDFSASRVAMCLMAASKVAC